MYAVFLLSPCVRKRMRYRSCLRGSPMFSLTNEFGGSSYRATQTVEAKQQDQLYPALTVFVEAVKRQEPAALAIGKRCRYVPVLFFRAMHPMRSHIVYISFYSSFVIFLFFRFPSRSALVTFVCASISGSTLIVFFSCHCCNNTPWPFFWTCKPIFLGAFICFVRKMQKAHVYFCPIFSKPRTGDTLYTADLWYTKSV